MTDLATAVAAGDLDALVRLVDGLCSAREWSRVVELRDRCRHAMEQRGLQLWPAAEYAEYRLALEAPGELASSVVDAEAGKFALGPLWEVAASTHTWADLRDHLAPGPPRALAAHDRVLRGEELSGDDSIDAGVLEIPLALESWEPRYEVATYRSSEAEFPAPDLPTRQRTELPLPGEVVEDRESIEALLDVGAVWAHQSNGTARTVAVEGTAEQAISALGHQEALVVAVKAATALALVGWAAASGGAYGKRRGAAMGRFTAWWAGAALLDIEWPPAPEAIAAGVAGLRWLVWEPSGSTAGWSACVAIEAPDLGLAWALEALDSHREEDALPSD